MKGMSLSLLSTFNSYIYIQCVCRYVCVCARVHMCMCVPDHTQDHMQHDFISIETKGFHRDKPWTRLTHIESSP